VDDSIALEADLEAIIGTQGRDALDVLEISRFFSADADDPVAWTKGQHARLRCLRRPSRLRPSLRLAVGDVEHREDQDGEQEVRHRSGQDN
jgi:hypothetical protein